MKLKTKEAKLLYKAACLIDEPEKWCKGTMTYKGQYCAAGAYQKAKHGVADGWVGCTELKAAFDADMLNVGIGNINDLPDTTHGDVMLAFANAIYLADHPEVLGARLVRGSGARRKRLDEHR